VTKLTVRLVVAGTSPGITLAGEKVHTPLLGSPEQLNCTLLSKRPPTGASEMEYVPVCPVRIFRDFGVALMLRSPGAVSITRDTTALRDKVPSEPTTVRV
jgi:hypothetical protein